MVSRDELVFRYRILLARRFLNFMVSSISSLLVELLFRLSTQPHTVWVCVFLGIPHFSHLCLKLNVCWSTAVVLSTRFMVVFRKEPKRFWLFSALFDHPLSTVHLFSFLFDLIALVHCSFVGQSFSFLPNRNPFLFYFFASFVGNSVSMFFLAPTAFSPAFVLILHSSQLPLPTSSSIFG